MSPIILGVVGPGFLNQVPTLPRLLRQKAMKLEYKCDLGSGD